MNDGKDVSLSSEETTLLNQYRSVSESGKRILTNTSQAIFDELANSADN
ncbi:Uncharacterised protein [Actinobacillus equuli]|nr:Uncharacterised protein [Actinobacillus equuli]